MRLFGFVLLIIIRFMFWSLLVVRGVLVIGVMFICMLFFLKIWVRSGGLLLGLWRMCICGFGEMCIRLCYMLFWVIMLLVVESVMVSLCMFLFLGNLILMEVFDFLCCVIVLVWLILMLLRVIVRLMLVLCVVCILMLMLM